MIKTKVAVLEDRLFSIQSEQGRWQKNFQRGGQWKKDRIIAKKIKKYHY